MHFEPGFRFNKTDLLVLLTGFFLSAGMYFIFPVLSYIIVFVVMHFFLFCNIIRMSRFHELIWTLAFILLAGSALLYENPSWKTVTIISLAITCLLVFLEIFKPGYHGIFWKKLNPDLPEWFAGIKK